MYGPTIQNAKIDDTGKLTIMFPNPELKEQIKRWQGERWDTLIMLLALHSLDFDKFKQTFNELTGGDYDHLPASNGHAPTESEFARRKDELLKWIRFLGSERTTNLTEAELWETTLNRINETMRKWTGEINE